MSIENNDVFLENEHTLKSIIHTFIVSEKFVTVEKAGLKARGGKKGDRKPRSDKLEKYSVNHIDNLPDCFIEKFLKDGEVSYEEWMQAQFLRRFNREYIEEKGEEWINNPDLDGDGFTNEFEMKFSFTDPYVCNERYAILVYSKDLTLAWKDRIKLERIFLYQIPIIPTKTFGL